jgi:hypothetical protein
MATGIASIDRAPESLHACAWWEQAAGDKAVRSILPNATIFKPAHLIGPEDRLFNNYAQLAKKLPFMPLVGGGKTKLQPTYVRDVADAVIHSLKVKDALGQDYYLAGPQVLTCAAASSLSCPVALVWFVLALNWCAAFPFSLSLACGWDRVGGRNGWMYAEDRVCHQDGC